ncbi:type II toxin-antitoxin system Phd/YefM family antitoxin [Salinarimonas sp.]|uniref:type II toxin-antitoxin system Phd/YefM family antitoxin n=1 Tax=Salinarimonas sp. TaxID=2766526 RepID=UPI0032D92584
MKQVNLYEAKTRLSQLVDDAGEGETIVIAKAGKPIAKLVPLDASPSGVRIGLLRGKIEVPADFDAPLPDDVLDAFEGRNDR